MESGSYSNILQLSSKRPTLSFSGGSYRGVPCRGLSVKEGLPEIIAARKMKFVSKEGHCKATTFAKPYQ